MPVLPENYPQPDVAYAVAAATVSTLVVLASFLLLCAKKGKRDSPPSLKAISLVEMRRLPVRVLFSAIMCCWRTDSAYRSVVVRVSACGIVLRDSVQEER